MPSSNEVFKSQESGQSATFSQQLSNDTLDTMIQSFKDKHEKKADNAIASSASDNSTSSTEINDLTKFVDNTKKEEPILKKVDTYAQMMREVDNADAIVSNNPQLNRQIEKLELQSRILQKENTVRENHIRETARTFSKQDMRTLSDLGPNPLREPANPKVGFEFNNAQRAWLKENHPDVYKLIEKHDRTSLESTTTRTRLNELNETKERPITARMELAQFQTRLGMDAEAIQTLTEVINTRPSIVTRTDKIDGFRSLAIEVGAAWNPAFRNAVEHSGGDILNFVQHPNANRKQIDLDFKPLFKPLVNEPQLKKTE